jgi:thymidylate synthase (FAD)
MDSHAQWEIQEFARAMYELAKPYFPLACEAFEDYNVGSVKVSRLEVALLKRLISNEKWLDLLEDLRDEDGIATKFDLSKRELGEFKSNWL